MVKSHLVDIDGRFVGTAVRLPNGYRFVAVDVRLDELDGFVSSTLPELMRAVRGTFLDECGPGANWTEAAKAGATIH